MAKAISEEELQLRKRARRRLVGAIALVSAVAVFLPMVLDHEPKPVNQDISIQIPAPNSSGTFTSKIVPVAPSVPEVASAAPANPPVTSQPEPVAKDPPVTDTEAAPPQSAAAKKPVPDKPKPVVRAAAKLPANSAPKPKVLDKAAPDATSAGGYVVQVAALNDADKAKEMQQKIASAGVKSYIEVVPTTKGNVTRVRAGPYATRADAEKMRDKLKDLGLGGNIIPK